MFFSVDEMVNLRLHREYQVPTIQSKKIDPQLIEPFRILERIDRLTYRLELPDNMRIHDVVSVAHLKPVINSAKDSYRRRRSPPSVIVLNEENEYEIEKLIRKRRIRRGRDWSTQYLIRWRDYGPEHDTWQPEHTVADTLALNDYERLHGIDSAIRTT